MRFRISLPLVIVHLLFAICVSNIVRINGKPLVRCTVRSIWKIFERVLYFQQIKIDVTFASKLLEFEYWDFYPQNTFLRFVQNDRLCKFRNNGQKFSEMAF